MAASKDILFWTPRGQLLRNQRIIPVTNISELVEYVLLPHNDDVVRPRALKTFIDGLAELGINIKRLIQNKIILAELMGKEQAYRDKDSEAGDEELVSESSDNEDGSETASEYGERQELENTNLEPKRNSDVQYSEETASPEILLKGKSPCYYCNGENVYQGAAVKCPRCFWYDGYKMLSDIRTSNSC